VTGASGGRVLQDQLITRIEAAALPFQVSAGEVDRLALYLQILSKWNRRINLTSLSLDEFPAKTIDRLIVEPLVAATFVGDQAASWFDLGSGGGSPAIPLKIVRPALVLTMVESRSKKASFLREAIRELGLERTAIEESRIEELPKALEKTAELITVRAVKLDAPIDAAIRQLLHRHGRLLWFGNTATAERESDQQSSTSFAGHSSSTDSEFDVVNRCALPADGGELIVLEKL